MVESVLCPSSRAPRGASGHIEPDRLAGRGQRGVRQRHAQRFADDLRRRGGAEKLAAAARASAGAAAQLGGLFERRSRHARNARRWFESCPRPRRRRRQRDAAGHEDAGQIAQPGQRHHHRRQSLVAGRDADARRARCGSERISRRKTIARVVAIGQAVHHAGRALRAAVAGVGDSKPANGHAAERRRFRSAAACISSPTSQWPV